MQTQESWMRKGTKSKYDKTKPCKPKSHEWEKERRAFMTYGFAWFSFVIFTLRSFSHSWLMALHGLALSYSLFVPFLIISHEWEKEQRVNMTKLNHAKP
jgi:hypothetical protein